MKYIAAYIKATMFAKESYFMQRQLVNSYCEKNSINVVYYVEEISQYSMNTKYSFRAWQKMREDILMDRITTILVDMKIRLCVGGVNQIEEFFNICKEKEVEIIEVSSLNYLLNDKTSYKNVAVYHFTDKSNKRPQIVEKTIDKLYGFISKHDDWKLKAIFLDYSLIKARKEKYKAMMDEILSFDIIVVKDFYHIEIKTMTFWNTVLSMLKKGIEIESLKEGKLIFSSDDECLERKYKIAIYYRKSEAVEEKCDFRMEVMKTFVSMKTQWDIKREYIDRRYSYYDKQPELQRLLENKSDFNLILVNTFGDINMRTSRFMSIKNTLGIPIYSLKEGGILL